MTSGDTGGALVKKTHPIRGLLWGIPFGLGLTVVLVLTKVIALDQAQVVIVFVAGLAIGLLWSLFGPAKKPKGAAPEVSAPAAAQAVEDPSATDIDDGVDEAGDLDELGEGAAGEPDDHSDRDESGDDGEPTSPPF